MIELLSSGSWIARGDSSSNIGFNNSCDEWKLERLPIKEICEEMLCFRVIL